ncbi:lantibiotic dehydratase family protein [Flavobacterium sp. Arc3]|uniref:lantibiotic dehydratase family protein n=1 Tax=Flavobacterium sp. Arc3 TaxID=3046686 RepID=UPI00352F7262
MKNSNYKLFNKFILRTPLLDFDSNFFEKLNQDDIVNLLKEDKIQESLFLASKELLEIINKQLETDNKISKESLYSILKYVSRMSTRCTPFGTFAGISLGEFTNNKSEFKLNKTSEYKNHIQLDMNVLFSIFQTINQNKDIRKYFNYYPNTSINNNFYQSSLNYIEYVYKNGKRNHLLTSVSNSSYLELILEKTVNGMKFNDLVDLLISEEIESEDAFEFINDLIDSQILINELEPYTTGDEPLNFIIDKIKNINELTELHIKLIEINEILNEIGTSFSKTNNIHSYTKIHEILKELNITFNPKDLFQSNLNISLEKNNLSDRTQKEILKGIEIINRLTSRQSNNNLENFKKEFYIRYQDQEVSLLEVLDIDNGIGYTSMSSKTTSPLLEDLNFPGSINNRLIQSDKITSFFTYKLSEAYLMNEKTINLNDEDLDKFDLNWDDLPLTMSSMVEIYKKNDSENLYSISNCGGSSAANILARFCNSNVEISKYVENEIIATENNLIEDSHILAEITHLPESRVGNILLRPQLREYEIPYLAKSNLPVESQIFLKDIYVSFRNNKILLKSKKLNKFILPRLTTAHNFNNPFLVSVYRFLCDIQNQNSRANIGFSWGIISENFIYLPRLQYKNIIISKAYWNLKKKHIEYLYTFQTAELLQEIKKWRHKYFIKDEVIIKDFDNKLYINFNNILSVELFLNALKNRDNFIIEEFLYNEYDSIVNNGKKDLYTNEFIFSFYKNNI